MLKETIFAATQEIRQRAWATTTGASASSRTTPASCRFDDEYNVVFKVETHNHPSAHRTLRRRQHRHRRRDPRSAGHRPGRQADLQHRRLLFRPARHAARRPAARACCIRGASCKGVVAGVRDYGNRMGIPTVNGAVYFDPRYLGNPLVYCGNVGLDPARQVAQGGPSRAIWIVAVGGRTGRDGIHGATFSSAELTSESETLSGGAVQIGNAITEKMVLDVLLAGPRPRALHRRHRLRRRRLLQRRRRDGREDRRRGLARASAAEVRGPLLHRDLDLRGPGTHGPGRAAATLGRSCRRLCSSEGVEATVIGQFVPTPGG